MAVEDRGLRLWQGTVETGVRVEGDGPPLVFLHGPWGPRHDGELIGRLARTHTVYAPRHPGTTPGDPDAIYGLADWLDLLVYYGELFDRLDLRAPAVVGYSFGGMVASELAAAMPERVGRLVLIAPLGLWREERPVTNWMILPEDRCREAVFADPAGGAAGRFFSLPEDRDARAEAQADVIWSLACTGKFVWPIPDRGLRKRIHRISAPTLILWGQQDGVIAPAYAQDFAAQIPGARVELIDRAGHLPHLEQPERVAALVQDFLRA
ncbi:MAG TPA: alpha/beta fold hydrolase [Chloroflexota bacterium]|nr:alpha/beta fold hydrolase [Chloroflexota bacterium]